MQLLSPEQYDRLRGLAEAWTRHRLGEARGRSGFNPRLSADALCFQRYVDDEGAWLVGALITPLSLSLAVLPEDPEAPPLPGSRRRLRLPSGEYPLVCEHLDEEHWYWGCELLVSLDDVASRQQASRLGQRLMERVMAPANHD